MNENNTTKWLRYLLYAGIASLVISLLGSFLLGGLTRWVNIAISAAAVYLMFRLIVSNSRYKTAMLFAGAALVISALGLSKLALAGSICSLVAQYQEYNAHGELVAPQDPKLANKWSSLFWLQFGVSVITVLLAGVAVGILAAAANMGTAAVTAMATVIAAVITLILKVLYLVYLNRTIRCLEAESL